MLASRALRPHILRQCRTPLLKRTLRTIPTLPDASLETFRRDAFEPALPALLPRGTFNDLPAVRKWCLHGSQSDGSTQTPRLNEAHLSRFASTTVPLEISTSDRFVRVQQQLGFFLEATRTSSPTTNIYLAQAPITDLPSALQTDLPTPSLVLRAGKGDVYDSSIWLGQAPTYTPLHRDPNPNLFVQLCGTKVVRVFRPEVGQGIFARVQEEVGGGASATMRGEEMMVGREREVLEKVVWGQSGEGSGDGWEAEVRSGDGLFVPKGWWHSIKGVGEGVIGSANWWFR